MLLCNKLVQKYLIHILFANKKALNQLRALKKIIFAA